MNKVSMFAVCSMFALAGAAAAQPAPPDPSQPPAPDPQPPPPSDPAQAQPPPAMKVAEPEPPKELPKKLAVGKEGQGFFNPGLLAQAWFLAERAGDTTTLSTFRLRRAEIVVKGEILPKRVAYSIMVDPAKVREFANVTVAGPPDAMGNPTTVTIKQPVSAVSVMQDFYITFLHQYVDVSIGQFKIPVSWEGYNSSGKLLFPERAIASNTLGDKRDLGMRFAKTFPKWGYSAGVFNGPGLNNFDNNNQKDAALRLEAYPIKGLTVAGVAYDSVGYRKRGGTKDRWEADLRYESGPYLLQAELFETRDVAKDLSAQTKGRGFYAAGGYLFKSPDLHGDLQPVVRVGFYDADTTVDIPATGTDEVWHYDVGLNYYLKAHEMKLQASFQRQQYDDRTPVNQVIVAAQVTY